MKTKKKNDIFPPQKLLVLAHTHQTKKENARKKKPKKKSRGFVNFVARYFFLSLRLYLFVSLCLCVSRKTERERGKERES
jgi:hypothetical protein